MTSLQGPVLVRWMRWLRDAFLRRYRLAKAYARNPHPTVSFDATRVRIVEVTGDETAFQWDAVRRIGYRTTESFGDDYFLEFHLTDGQVLRIVLSWPGAMALCDHVEHLPDARLDPERGILANVTSNDSIIIWPSREAGGSLDDC